MPKPRAAGIMFLHDGHVFLGKRGPDGDAPGTWAFPAGKIEDGESPQSAARRECYEEIGVDYRKPLHKASESADGFVTFAALPGRKFSADDEATDSDEFIDTGWFPFDKLPEPLHPGMMELTKMPLIEGKSDKARSENIKREIEAGKDPKQAAAIAYSVQRKAGGKDAKMARDEQTTGMLESLRKCAADCMAYDSKKGRRK